MSPEADHSNIEVAIANFSKAYRALEELQQREKDKPDHEALLPHKGDQKTGLIGEYWAIRYARTVFRRSKITFGHHSQKGWDLKVESAGREPHYIQVKTASAFGKGKLSPIFRPKKTPASKKGEELPDYWSELWLLWLDRELKPVTLWRLKPQHVEFNKNGINSAKSIRRGPSEPTTGSGCFDWEKAEAVTDILARFGAA